MLLNPPAAAPCIDLTNWTGGALFDRLLMTNYSLLSADLESIECEGTRVPATAKWWLQKLLVCKMLAANIPAEVENNPAAGSRLNHA